MNILQFSAGPNGTRNLGIGGGPNLMARNVVTAEDTHTDGLYWLRPYDLTQFGPAGEAAIAANSGRRYAWFWSSDHYDGQYGWAGGSGIHLAFTNDIAIVPKVGREVIPHAFSLNGHSYNQLETPWLIWKVEDEEYPFRLYGHAVNTSVNRQDTIVYKSGDLINWEQIGISHQADNGGHAGYQTVFRAGENDYWSFGLYGVNTTSGIWVSSDAETFTKDSVRTPGVGGAVGPSFLIGAQRYIIGKEDTTSTTDEGVFIALAPVDDDYDSDGSLTRISSMLGSLTSSEYPGPKYMQSVEYAVEDGIAHMWPKRGFFSDQGLVAGAEYGAGGGLDNQISDYYRLIIDETDARKSAPAGVRASVAGGVVTLDWYDALPQRTYRVYRDTDPELATKTLIADVTGTQATDTPGGTGTHYYEVVTLDGASEEGSRIVSPYVSLKSALVNEHVSRALAEGAPIDTIDLDHLAWAESVCDEIGVKNDLAYWVMPEFGHIKDGSNVMTKCFCLGSTLKPRGGDLTFHTSNTVYNATAWDGLPAWTASTGSAQSYFGSGRYNNIRNAHLTGLTLIGSFQRASTGTVTLLNFGEFSGYYLQVTSGSPGTVRLVSANVQASPNTDDHPTTVANGSPHIIGGVLSPTTATVYVEGQPGNGVARTFNTGATADFLRGQRSGSGSASMLLCGSQGGRVTVAATTAVRTYNFNNGQAPPIGRHLIVFTRALTPEQMSTLNARLRAGP